ncbi:carboxymuconolactone decarboxylase family protein [Novosphingobium aquae]|uniref:Carboxymuconolactone decarboxylase family protein n=1 Tax=Novosphingobium aquae TaxID=3133435 RepID=A0ABU8S4K5_9SPHN
MYQGSNLLDPAERSARGEALHHEVTGLKPAKAVTPYDQSWRDFIFAEVWSREGLDRRARYLVAIAGAALSSGEDGHLYGYVHGALKSKILSVVEMREAALHLSVYGGWSRGGHVDAAITKAVKALKLVDEPCAPIRGEPWDQRARGDFGGNEFMKVMTFAGGGGETPYLEAIRNFVFGEMWNRRALDERSRRWLTLVGVCESCAETPIKSHIYAAMASGNCKPAEMQEFVLAYGIHAGWPKASVIQGAVFAMTRNFEMGLGWNG